MRDFLEQLITELDARVKHWTLRTVNSEGKQRRYECKVWAMAVDSQRTATRI